MRSLIRRSLSCFAAWCCLLLCLAASSPAAVTYEAAGVVVHQCSCAYACPCMFENGPDNCALAAVYHLDTARYAGVDLSGLNMISIDGAVQAQSKAPAGVVYLDARATNTQRAALLGLLEAHGEWPGPGRPVRSVPISFLKTQNGYKTDVPGLFTGEAAGVLSRLGTPIVVEGVGFAEGSRWVVGRSRVNDLHDTALGLRWHLPDTNGSWSQFHWTH